jgi:hypothetical protein
MIEPRFFSQHPEDVARRHRSLLAAIEPLHRELARFHALFPRSYVLFFPADGPPEDLSPPWEEGLPEDVKQYVDNVRAAIRRTATEYGFDLEPLAQKIVTPDNHR